MNKKSARIVLWQQPQDGRTGGMWEYVTPTLKEAINIIALYKKGERRGIPNCAIKYSVNNGQWKTIKPIVVTEGE